MSRVPQANIGIDAHGERLLRAVEPISLARSLRAIGCDPQLKAAAVRQLYDLRPRLGVLDGEFGQGQFGIRLRWARALPTYAPTNLLDANGHDRTHLNIGFALRHCLFRFF
jgi:hypothetical protein